MSGNELERSLLCSRRRFGSGTLPPRRWMKPVECKHKRDTELSIYNDHTITPIWEIWKKKVLVASVRSLQHFFIRRVNRETFIINPETTRQEDAFQDPRMSENIDQVSVVLHGPSHCQHAAEHSLRRGHHFLSSPESCAVYCQLSKHGWYWGGITSKEAEEVLAGQHDNVFLVRDSYNSKHVLCVSFRCLGRTLHSRLYYSNGLFSLDAETFVPVYKLSEHCTHVSFSLFDTPMRLVQPLNRFAKLSTSLQMLCRFVIRQNVPSDKLHSLPLPPDVVKYVTLGSDYIIDPSTQAMVGSL